MNGTNTGSVTISNLSSSTTYDWRVSANCSTVPVNNYTSSQFTTSAHNSTIKNIKNGVGIKISPNPVVKGNAIIDFIVPGYGPVTITLLNAFGQRLQLVYSNYHFRGQYQVTLINQLDALPKGSYFLRVQQLENGYFTQFIKQ